MSVSSPNVSMQALSAAIGSAGQSPRRSALHVKLDRLIEDVRQQRSQMISLDRHVTGIEAYLKTGEWGDGQGESKSRPWLAAAATATARTVLVSVGAAAGAAALLYLAT